MSGKFIMWVVFDHPLDFPNTFVAKELEITAKGHMPTGGLMVCPQLEPIWDQLEKRGLIRMSRHPSDDSKIIETWV